MSNTNFTRKQGLVTKITESSWFSRPAGREGYEIVVLEKVGTGNRYYATLRPGDRLRLGEVVFGKFDVYAVDMRHGLAFPIEGKFPTQERNRKLTLEAKVRYRVTDSRQVAVGASDPLGEVRDKVLNILNCTLSGYRHESVNEGLCAQIIRRVGSFPNLGITVEKAEILQFEPERRTLDYRTEEEEQEHELRMEQRAAQAEIEQAEMRERSRMDLDEERIHRFDLRDPNVFMHVRPDMVEAVLSMVNARERANLEARKIGVDLIARAMKMYLEQKREEGQEFVSPDEVANFVREHFLSAVPDQPTPELRIDFGEVEAALDSQISSSSQRIEFDNQEKKENDESRIEFGEAKQE
jgi:hypothetical protein